MISQKFVLHLFMFIHCVESGFFRNHISGSGNTTPPPAPQPSGVSSSPSHPHPHPLSRKTPSSPRVQYGSSRRRGPTAASFRDAVGTDKLDVVEVERERLLEDVSQAREAVEVLQYVHHVPTIAHTKTIGSMIGKNSPATSATSYAYVTWVNENEEVSAAEALVQSIRQTDTKYPILVLMSAELDNKYKVRLEITGAEIVEIESVHLNSSVCRNVRHEEISKNPTVQKLKQAGSGFTLPLEHSERSHLSTMLFRRAAVDSDEKFLAEQENYDVDKERELHEITKKTKEYERIYHLKGDRGGQWSAVSGDNGNRAVLDKLLIWSLVNFRRVLYLEVDTLVMENLDFLFTETKGDSPLVSAAPSLVPPDRFDTSVMLIRPSIDVFYELLEASEDLCNSPYFSESMVLNSYFESWYSDPNPHRRMPSIFNSMIMLALIDPLGWVDLHDRGISVLHYNGKLKPYMCHHKSVHSLPEYKVATHNEMYRDLYEIWFLFHQQYLKDAKQYLEKYFVNSTTLSIKCFANDPNHEDSDEEVEKVNHESHTKNIIVNTEPVNSKPGPRLPRNSRGLSVLQNKQNSKLDRKHEHEHEHEHDHEQEQEQEEQKYLDSKKGYIEEYYNSETDYTTVSIER